MNPNVRIRSYLQTLKKTKVALHELEALFQGLPCTYEQFAQSVLELESDEILRMVQKQGRTIKRPALAYQYSLQKNRLKVDTHKDIHQARLLLHPDIQLDAYYSLGAENWEQDRHYIERVDAYLKREKLPTTPVPAPERSFELVADEKWITEKQGKELLTRIGLWDKLLIIHVEDPLMFAVNPYNLTGVIHRHLIVENKTTYQALLQAMPDVPFTTLIFGGGYRITRSIELLPMQLPLKDAAHEFYYFGDIDREGIHIWHLFNKKVLKYFGKPAFLALPFYRECLSREFAYGKENQRGNEEALQDFLFHFTVEEQETINHSLATGGYFPQEILPTQELCKIWRHTAWTT
ncbi:Wadjet anti-phage system protein JetD domain-containing protein [Paenibacillus sp. 2RAB27]|uniref:Wadjet anti-phage system protein JetD domain-containing protein n=1 Tax=Paenibacillus sp. 2RAB27 TaxID=3232991 RepID=UPI003F9BD598